MSDLKYFIEHARSKDMDHATIRLLLLSAGWKEKDIAEAMAKQGLDMPVPVPPDRGGAREAFLHLLTFSSLYITVISLIILFFTYIERLFPDPALQTYDYPDADRSTIRWSMAAIIVTYPLFVWITRMLLKEMRMHPDRAWSGIRRWLTYLTLFITALALIGDGVTLLSGLLEGELTTRFLLKVFTVLVLAGLTFAYYFMALRSSVRSASSMHTRFGWASLLIVLGAIIWGFAIAGLPTTERERKFDQRRTEQLRIIQSSIQEISVRDVNGRRVLQRALPATLDDVREHAPYQRPEITDPDTGAPYDYRVINPTTYELCATFTYAADLPYDVSWNHGAGKQCYQFDALDPKAVPVKGVPVPEAPVARPVQ